MKGIFTLGALAFTATVAVAQIQPVV